MNIQKIKAALAKQAQLLGVSPVAIQTKTASALNTSAPITAAPKTSAAIKDNQHAIVSADTVTAPVTISANPTVTPNIKKIPSESNATVSVSSSSTVQTPTLSASQTTVNTAADSIVSLVHSNQLSLPPETFLVPEEPKPARKRKKDESPVVEPIEVIVAKHLKAGRDYDRLPNTAKPTLFKSGAEVLCGVFGYRTTTSVINRVIDFEKSFVLYETQVTVYGADDKVVAEGIGSCNSRERKYLRGDFATQLNTILKMAKKRAYVDAILTACHASKVFTQDVEDIAAGVADDVSTKKGA